MIMVKKNNPTLEFDEAIYSDLRSAYESNSYATSEYWSDYVRSILNIIEHDKLSGFGNDYFLTQGFGDALRLTVPRYRLRKILKIPALYKLVEKYSVIVRYRKIKRKLFKQVEGIFGGLDFVDYLAARLDIVTNELRINRFIYIGGKRIPFRYLMFLLYIEILSQITLEEDIQLSLDELLDGNYLDIGGGYGCTPDGISLLKAYRGIGSSTVNYNLDQFPVTFIANQFLKFRNQDGLLEPLCSGKSTLTPDSDKNQSSYFRVIQNDVVQRLAGMDIKFFFNANSFQEMDVKQIEEYCQFIDKNKSESAYLALYLYDSCKDSNNPDKPLNIIKDHFTLVARMSMKELFDKNNQEVPFGVVKGALYLFDLSKR